jgi:quercetin dioxygenase-like cupin family protein
MQIYRFDQKVGRSIETFGSQGITMSPIQHLQNLEVLSIVSMHLSPGGILGYHPATLPQLFLVVQGEGWVRGEENTRTPISAGQAAFWVQGEGHESGSDTGMTAIVIESPALRPDEVLKRL